MAVLADVIMQIRRRIHDSDLVPPKPLYADVFYDEAVDRGLGRLNLDLDTSYTVASLPAKYNYLLDKRGTIEMCMVRGGEGASSDVSDSPAAPVQSVAVPNLTVAQVAASFDGPAYWLNLAEMLEEEYAAAMESVAAQPGTAKTEIFQHVMSRKSLRTGQRTPYVYDTALAATSVAVSLDVSTIPNLVDLSWDATYDERFGFYSVQRDVVAGFTSPTVVHQQGDNHTVSYTDNPGVGTWYYRVGVVNDNDLYAWSSSVTAVVV